MAFGGVLASAIRPKHGAALGGDGVPFALSQLPQAGILDHDPTTGVTSAATKVSAWAAKTGTGTFSTSNAAEKPTLGTTADGFPSISFDGASSGNILRGTEAFVENWWDFIVADRPNVDQNAVSSNKTIIESGRLSDSFGKNMYLRRVINDASQNQVINTNFGLGGGSQANNFPKLARAVLWGRSDTLSQRMWVNGTIGGSNAAGGSATATATLIGGSDIGVSMRAAIIFLRRLRIDLAYMPGGAEQLATAYLIEGFLAWAYGFQSSLRTDHPFYSRRPLTTDYTGNNRLWQTWGNSLCLGWSGQLGTLLGDSAVGITITNGGVGGETSTQIKTRFDASTTATRKKLTLIGECYANDSGASIAIATSDANIAAMVAATESAQGVAANNGHVIVIAQWEGNGNGGADSTIRAHNVTMAATYPNYFLDMRVELAKLGAPGAPYDDATAYASGLVPTVLRSGDSTHLTTQGYIEAATILIAFARAKSWAQ